MASKRTVFTSMQTLEDLKEYSQIGKYTEPNTDLKFKTDGFVVFDSHVYENYKLLLNNYVIKVNLSQEEFERYRYKPEVLASDIYGNPNLSHLILFLNACSEFTFDNNRVILLSPNAIDYVFEQIMIRENERLNQNKNEMLA